MIQTQPAACQCAWLRQKTFHEQFILLFRRERFRVVNFISRFARVTFHALHLFDTDKR